MSVRTVETINPPMTTVASGRCTSAPADVATAIGTKPNDATNPVRKTGRRRCSQPRKITLSVHILYLPADCMSLKWLIMRIPLSTATPKRAIKPTPAEILKGSPRSHNAAMPPIRDNGTVENTTNEYVTLRKLKNKSNKMSIKAIGITISNVRIAFCKFSN